MDVFREKLALLREELIKTLQPSDDMPDLTAMLSESNISDELYETLLIMYSNLKTVSNTNKHSSIVMLNKIVDLLSDIVSHLNQQHVSETTVVQVQEQKYDGVLGYVHYFLNMTYSKIFKTVIVMASIVVGGILAIKYFKTEIITLISIFGGK